MNIALLRWTFPNVKESHEVNILSVNIPKDLDWRFDLLQDYWLGCNNFTKLICQLNDVLVLAWELASWLQLLPFLWLEQ